MDERASLLRVNPKHRKLAFFSGAVNLPGAFLGLGAGPKLRSDRFCLCKYANFPLRCHPPSSSWTSFRTKSAGWWKHQTTQISCHDDSSVASLLVVGTP